MIKLDTVEDEPEEEKQEEDDVDEYLEPDEGKLLVSQRHLHADLKKEEPWQRDALFHTRCTSHGKVCSAIIDSRSYTNFVSEEMVMKLGLKIEKHPKPYNIHWLQDGGGMKITHHCLVSFSIDKTYCDELWCDVMKMMLVIYYLGDRGYLIDECNMMGTIIPIPLQRIGIT